MLDALPHGWASRPLEECMSAIIDYRGKTPRKTDAGVPLVTAKIVKGGCIETPTEFINPSEYDSWMRRGFPKAGDVVVTTEAPLGEVAQLDGRKVALAQRLICLRGRPEVLDNSYLKFLMQSSFVQEQLRARATGTTVLGIRQSELRQVQLLAPPLVEQRAIAAILGTLDDKIELNRRMNETLEAMARALFKSWFVDFDPVRAKMEGRAPAGMDAETAALFPDSFEDSELGPLPNGWRTRPLATIVEEGAGDIQTGPFGSQLHASDYRESGTPVVMPTNISNRRVNSSEIARIGTAEVERLRRHVLRAGDLVYSRRGDVEKHALIGRAEEGWLCGTGCLRIRPGGRLLPLFLSLYLDLPSVRSWVVARAVGATMPNLNTQILGHIPLLEPHQSIQARFCEVADPLDLRIQANNAESATLAELRDLLLPRLLSGELRVKDAEKLAEAAL
ncbi:restriction endonuclease subunit S [Sorangium sp. So ce1128]